MTTAQLLKDDLKKIEHNSTVDRADGGEANKPGTNEVLSIAPSVSVPPSTAIEVRRDTNRAHQSGAK